MNDLYRIPKDLAHDVMVDMSLFENSGESCSLCIYKACVDMDLTESTLLASLWFLTPGGCLAVECNHRTLSKVVDLSEGLSYAYDVVYFRGDCVIGHRFHTRRGKQIPYVLLFKIPKTENLGQIGNEVTLVSESPTDEIMGYLSEFTGMGKVLFIGDSLIMAPKAIAKGHDVMCFGDDPLPVIVLQEKFGVRIHEVEL